MAENINENMETAEMDIDLDKLNERLDATLNQQISEMDIYILKCHLLLEREITRYIEHFSGPGTVNFPFHTLLTIATKLLHAFELDVPLMKKIISFIHIITKLRNEIAHGLNYRSETMHQAMLIRNGITYEQIQEPALEMFNYPLGITCLVLESQMKSFKPHKYEAEVS